MPLSYFWIWLRSEYPALANGTVKTLMPFATTYLWESGFSALTSIKNEIQAQTVCGKGFKTDSLQSNPTLQSNVHPFKNNLLINLRWVSHNFRWTNKVIHVRWLNKEQNDLLLLLLFVPWSYKSFLSLPTSWVVTNSHSLCLINVLYSVCVWQAYNDGKKQHLRVRWPWC